MRIIKILQHRLTLALNVFVALRGNKKSRNANEILMCCRRLWFVNWVKFILFFNVSGTMTWSNQLVKWAYTINLRQELLSHCRFIIGQFRCHRSGRSFQTSVHQVSRKVAMFSQNRAHFSWIFLKIYRNYSTYSESNRFSLRELRWNSPSTTQILTNQHLSAVCCSYHSPISLKF